MPSAPSPKPYTVASLTAELKGALESRFTRIYVEAEISGWKLYPSGHAYFSLKDANAQISCVMFASCLERCRARAGLKDGAKVVVYGNVTVYAPRGNYQLTVLAAKLVGEGDLMQRYLELKAKLEGEGLFDRSRKRPLPFLPRRIGIVTSEAGAVIHDMCTVLTRRFPNLDIRLWPSLVQGAEAPRSIIAGITYFNACEDWRADILIVARGGGSFEDLFCFNDESLVREVAMSKIPTISAVGHETDYTLCDFAADVRAGTPSIAAELAVPMFDDLTKRLSVLDGRMASALRGKGEWFAQRVDQLSDAMGSALGLSLSRAAGELAKLTPRLAPALTVRLERERNRLAAAEPRLRAAAALRLERDGGRLERARAKLELLSPYSVLDRGYSLTTTADGHVVRDAAALKSGDVISTRFANGEVTSTVT